MTRDGAIANECEVSNDRYLIIAIKNRYEKASIKTGFIIKKTH